MGIVKQLTQFQIKDFEDWWKAHNLPSKDPKEETLEEKQSRNPYYPLRGEICGIIFQNDKELQNAWPIVPDAYENSEFPFVILKMGDGERDLWELPWTNLINKEVVQELVNNLFTNKNNQSEGFMQTINSMFERTVADWEQNDPNEYSYIKNRICQANYSEIPITNIVPENKYEVSEPYEYNNKVYHINILEETFEPNDPIIQELSDMDKYQIQLKNCKTNENISFTNTLHLVGNAPSASTGMTTFWGLGNSQIWCDYINQDSENLYNLVGEKTTDPFGIIFAISTDSITLEQVAVIYILLETDFVDSNVILEEYYSQFSINHIAKCNSINTISNKWLPKAIQVNADWTNQSPGTPGYIKNKICSVLAYENEYKNYLSNYKAIFPEGYFGCLVSTLNSTIPNFGIINVLNKYTIKLDDKYIENLQFLQMQDQQNDTIYLLGNPYLYIKWMYDLCLAIGGMPELILELMNSTEDNGVNVCLLCEQVNNDLSVMIMVRPQEEYYKKAPIILNAYKIKDQGIVLENNIIRFDNINLIDKIYKETKTKDQYFLEENKKYYLGLEGTPDIYYLIKTVNYNEEDGHTYVELDKNPNLELNSLVSPILFKENAFHTISFSLTSVPSQIQTIDPLWLPEEVKVGQYNDTVGLEISAEIFNDYINNKALGSYSHAEGYDTIASGNYQHVQGKRNIADDTSAFIIGNGDYYRSNAYKIDWNGNSVQSGQLEATEVKAGNHLLSNKEDSNNKVNIITDNDKENNYPNSKAVINYTTAYIQNLLNISPDKDGNITLEFTSIDGNGIYK